MILPKLKLTPEDEQRLADDIVEHVTPHIVKVIESEISETLYRLEGRLGYLSGKTKNLDGSNWTKWKIEQRFVEDMIMHSLVKAMAETMLSMYAHIKLREEYV